MSILFNVFDYFANNLHKGFYHKRLAKTGKVLNNAARYNPMNHTTIPIIALAQTAIPDSLQRIPQPPRRLSVQAQDWQELLIHPRVAIVGSRKVSAYGRAVTEQVATAASRAGAVIVSGLALGIDSIAHQAALQANGKTIAILPSGLKAIYPAGHYQLAQRILAQGGALISEYPPEQRAKKWTFVERNRLVSGFADALVVTEAAEKSGTLHTAAFALDQGIPVCAVPGNITSETSKGTNRLIQMGATPILAATDVLDLIGLKYSQAQRAQSSNPDEQCIITLIYEGISDGQALLKQSKLSVAAFSQALTMLEIHQIIRPLGGNQWTLA